MKKTPLVDLGPAAEPLERRTMVDYNREASFQTKPTRTDHSIQVDEC